MVTENLVNCTIDGKSITVPERTTILDAAKMAGIKIPTLCFLKDINEIGACRVCVVEPPADSLQQLGKRRNGHPYQFQESP